MRKIIPYDNKLVPLARKLRNNMTLAEVLFWQEIKNKQLGVRFSRQIPIDRFIVDFYCKDLLLAIEVDGDSHYHDDQPEKDKNRQMRLESLGIRFLRFDDLDIRTNIKWVLNEIYHVVQELNTSGN
ncbi:MAG: endonuclease domain-containing protein [Reichenbachiella sp.]|uniref:endonuclease domain-containing protein n=1 Tax=Reichenbachiella sp. TaxID=2184521 RepID=UPI002966936B|nr:endonuclease domain-containing protein [Reichenbachiella sp.]MDW3209767.1 endonuclease domain-containing protein [Reichenbachiella sp.]